eukprot:CAMPEP_0185028220 /NCGR_PEP_ID=MMETSP1103-20130426/13860_1 /TAXON_ID=36769 /ORGANISM="Paraphysomonas bandaiensis, Strain Caron Lab Isolate" /LENGTH=244 /DNA_ID=CAMNT_0027562573 /DNA_START=66 /DNA_END=800 /DNA_ORIENTATION=+
MGPKPKGRQMSTEEVDIVPEKSPDIPHVTTENFCDFTWVFNELFKDHQFESSRDASKKERDENHYTATSLVYGEIAYEPFAEQFLKIRTHGYRAVGGKYVDIGSGSGKSVFGAALVHKFEDCIGIEVLESLYKISDERLHEWNSLVNQTESLSHLRHTKIQFVHGDATAIDWSDADVVFMNSTCFEDDLLAKLAAQAANLKPGSFVLSTTRKLPSDAFEIMETTSMMEVWGECTLFIQRRKTLS